MKESSEMKKTTILRNSSSEETKKRRKSENLKNYFSEKLKGSTQNESLFLMGEVKKNDAPKWIESEEIEFLVSLKLAGKPYIDEFKKEIIKNTFLDSVLFKRCPLCNQLVEDSSHCFLSCKFILQNLLNALLKTCHQASLSHFHVLSHPKESNQQQLACAWIISYIVATKYKQIISSLTMNDTSTTATRVLDDKGKEERDSALNKTDSMGGFELNEINIEKELEEVSEMLEKETLKLAEMLAYKVNQNKTILLRQEVANQIDVALWNKHLFPIKLEVLENYKLKITKRK